MPDNVNTIAAMLATMQLSIVELFKLLDAHDLVSSDQSAACLRRTANQLPTDAKNSDTIRNLLHHTADLAERQPRGDVRSMLRVIDGGRSESPPEPD